MKSPEMAFVEWTADEITFTVGRESRVFTRAQIEMLCADLLSGKSGTITYEDWNYWDKEARRNRDLDRLKNAIERGRSLGMDAVIASAVTPQTIILFESCAEFTQHLERQFDENAAQRTRVIEHVRQQGDAESR